MKSALVLKSTCTALALGILTFQVGCTTAGTPGIPGVDKSSAEAPPIPTHVVLLALKAQFADAMKDIEQFKQANPGDYSRVFDLKKGTGVFTGTTQIVNVGNASISAVIPFTGYKDSKLKPKLGLSGNATNVQATALTFELSPVIEHPDRNAGSDAALQNVQVGTFVRDALVTAFKDAAIFTQPGRSYEPKLKFAELAVVASFTVVQKREAGLGETIILLPAPDLDSLSPTASGSNEKTGVYRIELKFALNVDAPADSRRITKTYPALGGGTVVVEEPYTSNRFTELTGLVEQAAGGGPAGKSYMLTLTPEKAREERQLPQASARDL